MGISESDLKYLASISDASGEVGKKIYNQIKSIDTMALPAWGAKNMIILDKGKTQDVGDYLGGFQFDAKGIDFKGRVIIYLKPDDTYTILFGKLRGTNWNPLKKIDGVVVYNLVSAINEYVK